MSQALRLPFDQYQRYRLVTDILDRVRRKGRGLRVLDVGGRTGLLRLFLRNDQVTLVDVEPGDISNGFVLGTGSALPFRDDAFDVVCAFDTLEHVPKAERTSFVTECARVAGSFVVLAGPYDSPEVKHAEVLLRRFLKEKLGIQHRYLEEHRQNGLPKRNVVEGQLEQQGAEVVSVGHANLERWFGLMCLEFYLDDDPALRKMAESIYEFYNRGLYASDHRAPVYRHAVVAAMGKATLPDLSVLFPEAAAPAGALASFNEMLKSLVAFDRERDNWREERAAFEQSIADLSSDLEGHRGTLQHSIADVDGNRKTVEVLQRDLDEHKQTLAALRAQEEADRKGFRKTTKALEKDLAEHKRTIESLRAKEQEHLGGAQKTAELLQADLEEHKRSLEALREREKELDLERERIDGLREEAERRAAEFEAQSSYHSERFEEEHLVREALEEDMRQHLLVLRELRKNHEEATTSLAEVTRDLEQHHVVLEETKQQAAEYEKIATEVTERRDEALEHAKTLEAELQSHRRVTAEYSSEKQRLGDDRDKLRVQLGEVREELDRVQSVLVNERQQSTDLATKLRGELAGHSAHAQALEAEIEKLRGAHVEAVGELGKYQTGTAGIESELERVRKEAKELESRRHEAVTERDRMQQRVAELEERVLQQGARYQGAEQQLGDVARMEEEWNTERAAFNDAMSEVLRELEEHRTVLAEITKQRDEAMSTIPILEQDLDGHRRVLARMQKDQDEAKKAAAEWDAERKRLQEYIATLEGQLPRLHPTDGPA